MRHILTSILVSILIVGMALFYLGERHFSVTSPVPSDAKGAAYSRIMQTGTLRCGWYVMPPFFQRDPNTGTFSGIYYDVMEEIGRQLSLKIEWTEEVTGATAFEGLRTKRYDVVCAAFAPLPGRAKVAAFTIPLSFRPIYAYSRANDKRFDRDSGKIDDPSVKISVIEGQGAHLFAQHLFPKANLLVLPSFSDLTQNELNVSQGKADLSLAEASTAERFMKNNPGKIRRIAGPPLITVADTLQVGVGEEPLKSLLNTTLEHLIDLKFMARVHERYLGKEGDFYLLSRPR